MKLKDEDEALRQMEEARMGRQRAARKQQQGVTFRHLAPMLKAAWEHGFTEERNKKGWVSEGIIPFSRNQYWKLREEEAARAASNASDRGSGNRPRDLRGAAQQHEGQQPPADSTIGTTVQPEAGANQAANAGSTGSCTDQEQTGSGRSGSEQILCPPRMAAVVAKAQQLTAPADLASLSKEEILQAYIQQHEIVNDLVEGIRPMQEDSGVDDDSTVPEGQEDTRVGRITAKNFYGLQGSVTGPEALALARRKEAERKAKAEAAAAKAKEREDKRRGQVATALVRGSDLLRVVQEGGEARLLTLPAKDLVALLVHADPTAPAPKGNKADLLEKVRALPAVVEAVAAAASRHLHQTQPAPVAAPASGATAGPPIRPAAAETLPATVHPSPVLTE